MNLQEQIEKAFKAGAEFIIENTESWDEIIDFPNEYQIDQSCTEYINGNLKSSQS